MSAAPSPPRHMQIQAQITAAATANGEKKSSPAAFTSADHSAMAPAPADWGASNGFPSSTAEEHRDNPEGLSDLPMNRVGDYSGGYEDYFPHHMIRGGAPAGSPLGTGPGTGCSPLVYRYDGKQCTLGDYLNAFPVTGLLVARGATVLAEEYRFGRTAEMRLQSWSMAKSVTTLVRCVSLLLYSHVQREHTCYLMCATESVREGCTERHLIPHFILTCWCGFSYSGFVLTAG